MGNLDSSIDSFMSNQFRYDRWWWRWSAWTWSIDLGHSERTQSNQTTSTKGRATYLDAVAFDGKLLDTIGGHKFLHFGSFSLFWWWLRWITGTLNNRFDPARTSFISEPRRTFCILTPHLAQCAQSFWLIVIGPDLAPESLVFKEYTKIRVLSSLEWKEKSIL